MVLSLDSPDALSFQWSAPLSLTLAQTVSELAYPWRLLWMTSQASFLNVFNKGRKFTR